MQDDHDGGTAAFETLSAEEMTAPIQFVDQLRSLVAAAASSGEILEVGPHARRLAEAHATDGLTRKAIFDKLVLAAARAGVPIAMDQTAG